VPAGNVPGLIRLHRKGNPHQLGKHGVLGGGLGIHRQPFDCGQAIDQGGQGVCIQNSLVPFLHRAGGHRKLLVKLAEFQLLKQVRQTGVVGPGIAQGFRVQRHGRLGIDGHQPAAQKGLFFMGGQFFTLLFSGNGVQPGVQAIHTAKLAYQRLPGLGPDPGHSRNVVRRISRQPHHVDHLPRFEAVCLPHRRQVGDPVLHGIPYGGHFRNQLDEILVTGNHDHMKILLYRHPAEGADEIVCLEPGLFDHRNVECGRHLLDQGQLPHEVFGHGGAVGLVRFIHFVAKRRPLAVETNAHILR
jgi:hypothetical protein